MIRRDQLSHVFLCLGACLAGVFLITGAGRLTGEAPGVPPQDATVRHFGAIGDGVADDTAALEAAVASGLGEVRLPRGVYRITRTVHVDLDRLGPKAILGGGTARIVMAGGGPAIRFAGTHQGTAAPATVQPNVWQRQRMPLVDGIEIVGDHPDACGIEAAGTMQLTITRVNVRRVLHAIHLVQRNRNVIVAHCHLYENRGVGLYLDDVNLHQINVSACHVSYNAGGGIVSRAGNVRNLQISGCDVEANMSADGPPTANVLIDCRGGQAGTAEVAVTGCTIQHSHEVPGSANVRYIGSDAEGRRWGHVTIAGNVLSDVAVNVDVQGARAVSILGNTFWKGQEHNLRVVDSSAVVVGPNVFDRSPHYEAEWDASNSLVLSNCQDCTLTGFHLTSTSKSPAGLVLENCRRMNLAGLSILDCDNAGLLLRGVSESRVSDCHIRNDRDDAGPWTPLVTEDCGGNRIEGDLLEDP